MKKLITLASTIDDANIMAFINQASLFVDTYLSSSDLDDDVLKIIEENVAAHMLCIMDPRLMREKIDVVEVQYLTPKTGEGLKGTSYGQMAIMMDPTGTLAKVGEGKRKKASLGMIDYNTDV